VDGVGEIFLFSFIVIYLMEAILIVTALLFSYSYSNGESSRMLVVVLMWMVAPVIYVVVRVI
jgi:hypothetical protein